MGIMMIFENQANVQQVSGISKLIRDLPNEFYFV